MRNIECVELIWIDFSILLCIYKMWTLPEDKPRKRTFERLKSMLTTLSLMASLYDGFLKEQS